MTSFILVSQSKEKRREYINEFLQKQNIDKFDLTFVEKDETTKNLHSLGIQDVKNLQKKIFLKPFKSKEKAVVLDDAHLLTVEAQNALLKLLEEPPDNTYIFLSSQTIESFLPTILSRCKVLELENAAPILTDEEEKELVLLLNQLPKMKIGDKLKKAELLTKNKEDASLWLEKITLTARQQLLKSPNPKRAKIYANFINTFQATFTQLKTTNINPRFALEQMLLSIK